MIMKQMNVYPDTKYRKGKKWCLICIETKCWRLCECLFTHLFFKHGMVVVTTNHYSLILVSVVLTGSQDCKGAGTSEPTILQSFLLSR